jgi:hypothetical protein
VGAETGIFGKDHRERPKQIKLRIEVLPSLDALFDVGIAVNHTHGTLQKLLRNRAKHLGIGLDERTIVVRGFHI